MGRYNLGFGTKMSTGKQYLSIGDSFNAFMVTVGPIGSMSINFDGHAAIQILNLFLNLNCALRTDLFYKQT